MKRSVLLLILMIFLMTQVAYAMPSNWALESVEYALDNHLVTYEMMERLQEPINRNDFAKMVILLYEAISSDEAPIVYFNPFNDTSNIDILKAYQLGIVNGKGNGRFSPNDLITRQEIAVMLLRTLFVSSAEISFINNPTFFYDENLISPWAKEAVHTLYQMDVLNGVGNNEIDPLGMATREQVITLCAKIHKQQVNGKDKRSNALLTSTEIGAFSRSVVKIYVETYTGETNIGSGFFYEPGKIATNYHVMEGANKIEFEYDDGTLYSSNVSIIGYDPNLDLVALTISDTHTPALPLGNSDTLIRGSKIYTIGSPMGLTNTLGSGIVSSIRHQSIQITSPISPGSSGGALLDEYGNVVGITNAGIIEGENLGFAIPINLFKEMDKSRLLALSDVFKKTEIVRTIVLKNATYEGDIQNGLPHGNGTMTFNDGDVYEGNWVEGRFEGLGMIAFGNGDLYKGQFVDWHYSGKGIYYYSNGEVYDGDWSESKQNGYGIYRWPNGKSYFGDWKAGMYHGYGIYTFEDGTVLKGIWKFGEFEN